MTPILSALLCLGVSLAWKTHVKAETLPKPTIWADPGPVIPREGPLTIWCQGSLKAQEYRLYANGSSEHLDTQKSLEPGDRAQFLITRKHVKRYTCNYLGPTSWSEHSDSLQLMVTGYYSKPRLSSLPGPVVPSGGNVTLQCDSERGFGRFILIKEGDHRLPWALDSQQQSSGRSQALFPVGPVTPGHRWMFRCYGCYNKTPNWCSHPSDALELLISGSYSTPRLSALPGPVVPSGGNVTLQCDSEQGFDKFLLTKEGDHKLSWALDLQRQPSGRSQALFPVGPVTPGHKWMFRCYGCYSDTPQLCSHPSDALELLDSGPSEDPSPPTTGPTSTAGLKWNMNILIGVSVGLVLLVFLLLFYLRHRRQSKGRTSDASVKDSQPGNSMELDLQTRQDEGPQGVMYTQVNRSRPRPAPGMAASPSSPLGALLDQKGRHAEGHTQAAPSNGPQNVTYAQLNLLALRRQTSAPPSEEPPEKPSLYAALAFH